MIIFKKEMKMDLPCGRQTIPIVLESCTGFSSFISAKS
jgi:hypothetical protein